MYRVLRLLNRMAIGGPVLNATYLTKYLSPEFETLLVAGEIEDHEKSASFIAEKLKIHVHTIPHMRRVLNPINDLRAFQEIRKLINEFRPDVVHTHASKPGVLGRLAASIERVPVIIHTFHGHTFNSYFNKFTSNLYINTERYLARKSTVIIAISETQKKELAEDFRIAPAEKFRVIPLGLDLEKFQEDQIEKRRMFREEFHLADDEIAIGIIGRLVLVKNHSLFLKAIAYVLRNTSKKIKAFIVGDGETRKELETMARKLFIPFSTEQDKQHLNPLVFTSWRKDMDIINAGLDIVALTSLNEGTPVSLIEAQAANRPIVSTRVGGISDIVIEGKTALLADVNDQEGFCRKLLQLTEDEQLRAELGNNSHYHVIRRFGYLRMVNDTAELYHQVLGNKIPANPVFH